MWRTDDGKSNVRGCHALTEYHVVNGPQTVLNAHHSHVRNFDCSALMLAVKLATEVIPDINVIEQSCHPEERAIACQCRESLRHSASSFIQVQS